MTRTRAYDPVKRALDIFGAAMLFAVTLPFQALIATLIRVKLGSPVLFRQQRPGKDGELFTLVKFRTMKIDGVSDADRMTPLGRQLRALSLDELPTLINVLKGDMSLVGPRPLLVEYLALYSPEQAQRHDVRPGITGSAQVSGRNGIPWDKRLALDVDYVHSRSLLLDLRILFRTLAPVIGQRGITESGAATMSRFRGSPS